MKYLALLYGDESTDVGKSPEEMGALIGAYEAFGQWAESKHPGAVVGGDALMPSETAKTVRVRAGKQTVTDGPFAETKEHLGGYYLIEAESIDQAIEIAARIPAALDGSVEVRPIMILPT